MAKLIDQQRTALDGYWKQREKDKRSEEARKRMLLRHQKAKEWIPLAEWEQQPQEKDRPRIRDGGTASLK